MSSYASRVDTPAHALDDSGGAPTASRAALGRGASLGELNSAVWRRGGYVADYVGQHLRDGESVLLARHRDALAGRVLELGCGGGRITRHLIGTAAELHGVDIASDMVEHCRRTLPSATFGEGDIRDLSPFASAGADAIVAGNNLIDILDDDERGRFLDEVHRILAPHGLLVFSSHNLACVPLVKSPLQELSYHPLVAARQLAGLPRRLRGRRRLALLQSFSSEYAIVNDNAHDYALLHYYISRDGQERQLAAHGFRLLECVDLAGTAVAPGEIAYGCHELHYAARRVDPPQDGDAADAAAAPGDRSFAP